MMKQQMLSRLLGRQMESDCCLSEKKNIIHEYYFYSKQEICVPFVFQFLVQVSIQIMCVA